MDFEDFKAYMRMCRINRWQPSFEGVRAWGQRQKLARGWQA